MRVPSCISKGVASWGVHPQILADQLTLSQLSVGEIMPTITTGTPGFPDLLKALNCNDGAMSEQLQSQVFLRFSKRKSV